MRLQEGSIEFCHTVYPSSPVFMQIKLVLVFTAVLFQLGNAHGGVHVISELTDPAFLLAGAVVAEDAVVYIAGNGVAAVNVSNPTQPELLVSLRHPLLFGCGGLHIYRSADEGNLRLAVTCSSTDTLMLIDVENPRELKVLGTISDFVVLSRAADVVVKGNLAFVAVPGAASVVSFDITSEASPVHLSSIKLSGADSVSLLDDAHLVVASERGRRVSILSFSPHGVLFKIGSIKDERFDGVISILKHGTLYLDFTFVISAANGGTFAVLNTTSQSRPSIVTAMQASVRLARPAATLKNEGKYDELGVSYIDAGWAPYGHKSILGATGMVLIENLIYIVGNTAGTISVMDVSDPSKPRIIRELNDARLIGAANICAANYDQESISLDGVLQILVAAVPSTGKLVLLKDTVERLSIQSAEL